MGQTGSVAKGVCLPLSKRVRSRKSKRESEDNRAHISTAGVPHDSQPPLSYSQYNYALLDELHLLKQISSRHKSSLTTAADSGHDDAALAKVRSVRLLGEEGIWNSGLVARKNTFISFSPWKFRLEFPLCLFLTYAGSHASNHHRRQSAIEPSADLDRSIAIVQLRLVHRNNVSQHFSPVLVESSEDLGLGLFKLLYATVPFLAHTIELSSQYGRVIGYDFRHPSAIQLDTDSIAHLPVYLLIFQLCWIFHLEIVDGIPFQRVSLADIADNKIDTPFAGLNDWLLRMRAMDLAGMLVEFNRMIMHAFKVKTAASTVIAFFGVEAVTEPINLLPHLVNAFADCAAPAPVCIMTGSSMGNLEQQLSAEFSFTKDTISAQRRGPMTPTRNASRSRRRVSKSKLLTSGRRRLSV